MYPRRVYVEAIKRAGLALRLPCVNHSSGPFTLEKVPGTVSTNGNGSWHPCEAIRVGLDAIATLDEQVRAALLAERQRHGPFRDLADFRRRVRPGPETLAVLIRCGALDFTGQPRPALFLEAELQDQTGDRGDELFSALPLDGWRPSDYGDARRLQDEWDLLGFVVGPPLMSLFRPRLPPGLITSRELPGHVGRTVRLAGLVATSRRTQTSDNRTMQFVTLEDEWGLIEVTLFPGTCPPAAYLTLGPYLVTGRVEEQHDVIAVTAREFRCVRA
jgi:DNA polymerase-3 subunit alpha